jgi:hypothetical protein
MGSEIQAGSILIGEAVRIPAFLRSESAPFSNGWRLVRHLDGHGLRRKIREAGWTFAPMAGEIKATALGFGREQTARRAVKRSCAKPGNQMFNCLEITQVVWARFLGLIRVIVTARPRCLQGSAGQSAARDLAAGRRSRLVGA